MSVVALGNQTDNHLAPDYPNRDGGAVGSLSGKIVWFWSDTEYLKNGVMTGFYGNTGAIGDPSNPLIVNGPMRQAIPFTPTETAFNNQYSFNPRVVLWPKSGVVEVSPGQGILYVPKGYWGKTITGSEPNQGVVVCKVVIGSDGYPEVTRLGDEPLFPLNTAPQYGGVAAVKDDKYIYLYSSDRIATYSAVTFVARVPIGSSTEKSAFQYFWASNKSWESVFPAPTDTKEAIISTTFGLDGNVYYSGYLKKWVLIYQHDADDKVYMRTAFAPEGPWENDTMVYSPPEPTNPTVKYIYGTTGTDLYDPSGKTSSICFTWCYANGYANWVARLTFD